MIVLVNGTKSFNDYNVFIRAMGVAMSGMSEDDKSFIVYSLGPSKINSMVSEFCNLSERGMKSRGMKIKKYNVTQDWVEENLDSINYFVYLKLPNEKLSKLVALAELNNMEIGVFSY